VARKIAFSRLVITRTVLDQFQDSSKTGSGINFFAAFFGPALLGRFFE